MTTEHTPAEEPKDPVLCHRMGPTTVLSLNRPHRLNAVSFPLYSRLLAELRRAGEDPDVRCVVLTGKGRAFSVGADLKAHGKGVPEGQWVRQYVSVAQRVNFRIQMLGKPVIAAVNGHAIGAGLEMALSSDFMIVADNAKLRFPEVSLGTFIGGGAIFTLAERVGTLKARELIYLGDFFTGAEAAAMGIANEAVPAGEVLDRALAWAARLVEKAPRSLAHAKRLIGPAGPIHRLEAMKREARALREIMGTRDWQEGVDAFAEDRAPEFTGE